MLPPPRWLLHVEGAAIFALSLFFYRQSHYGWGMFALLLLAPDWSMLGYLANVRLGASFYNSVHTSFLPIALLWFGLIFAIAQVLPYGLIWISHIGLDRLLGYRLKYPTQFRDTHLQHV